MILLIFVRLMPLLKPPELVASSAAVRTGLEEKLWTAHQYLVVWNIFFP
jgi:hypothetical protein